MNSNQITIAQILAALSRHKFKSAMMFLLVMSMVAVAFLLWPRKFGSEGKLNVLLSGHNLTSVSPAAGTNGISIQDSRETEVRSVVELIKSRAVIDDVVREIGAEKILESPWDKFRINLPLPNFSSSDGGAEGMTQDEFRKNKRHEEAAKLLDRSMTVYSEKKTSIISIYFKARSARLAQKLADSVMAHTRRKQMDIHSISGSTGFYEDGFSSAKQERDKAISAQTDFRNELQVLSTADQRNTLSQVLSRLENDRISAETALAGAEKRVELLSTEVAKVDRMISVPKAGVEKKSFEDSRTEVFKLENELISARTKFKDSHPNIMRITEQLEMARKSLKEMDVDRVETASEPNPVYDSVNISYVNAMVDRDAGRATLDDVNLKVEKSKKDLVALNDAEIKAGDLQLDVDVANQRLEVYKSKIAQVQALSEFDICEVSVLQPGNLVVKHISPKGKLIAPLGVALSMLAALGTALYFERNHLSAALGEEEVEQILELPVLVTLPRVYSSRNMVN